MTTDKELRNTEQPYTEPEQMEQALTNVRTVLLTQRRRFYPNKSFGSRLRSLQVYGTETAEIAALAAVRQALAEMDGVYALKASVRDGMLCITLSVNGTEGEVSLALHEENDGNIG